MYAAKKRQDMPTSEETYIISPDEVSLVGIVKEGCQEEQEHREDMPVCDGTEYDLAVKVF